MVHENNEHYRHICKTEARLRTRVLLGNRCIVVFRFVIADGEFGTIQNAAVHQSHGIRGVPVVFKGTEREPPPGLKL